MVCYLFFNLVPSAGPQFYFDASIFKETGGFFYQILGYIENNIEIPSGAFPSSHVAIETLVLLYALFRLKDAWRWALCINCLGLFVSTVYIRAHYLIDVIAGIATGVICYYVFGKFGRRWIHYPH